jgi:hypothetical protein
VIAIAGQSTVREERIGDSTLQRGDFVLDLPLSIVQLHRDAGHDEQRKNRDREDHAGGRPIRSGSRRRVVRWSLRAPRPGSQG